MSKTLPDCGIYRTGLSLAGHEEQVPSGALIYFHNHSEKGPPLVLAPMNNANNRWTWSDRGWLVDDQAFWHALVPLKSEGFYTVTGGHLHLTREEILPERTLVQLGYNRAGDSILFVGRFEGNSIVFPTKGYRFPDVGVQERLVPAGFKVPAPPAERTLH